DHARRRARRRRRDEAARAERAESRLLDRARDCSRRPRAARLGRSASPDRRLAVREGVLDACRGAGRRDRACPELNQASQPKKKNWFHAAHHVSAVERIRRSSTISTAGTRRSLSTASVTLYSTSIVHGLPGWYGATASRSLSARLAPSSISSRARSAGI